MLPITAPYWGPAAIGYLVTTAKIAQPLLVTLAATSKTAVAIAGELAKTAYSKIAIFLEAGMTNTKALMQILLSEGVPREIVFEFIEAAVETHLDEGTVEDFLLYGLVGAGIEIVSGSEVTQKVIKDGVEELLDTVNDIVLSPEARELKRNARKNAKEATEEHIERTVKTNAKEKLEGGVGEGKTVITPEMESKILEGQRKLPKKNELIGGHSPDINNSNPRYVVEKLEINPDGSKRVGFYKQFEDEKLSNYKKSTIFPDSWTNESIIENISKVGKTSPIGTRVRDGATLHRSIIDGVEIEVIKINEYVTSGFPTGGGRGVNNLGSFEPIE